MTTLRPFSCDDLFRYNNINLDPLTETYNLAFYLMYMSRWGRALLMCFQYPAQNVTLI
jgi:ribosomal protein S18 acetylase RimI-like enzyme